MSEESGAVVKLTSETFCVNLVKSGANKPDWDLCLVIVCTTVSEKSDDLRVEKQDEFTHEIQSLFTFRR